MGKLNEKDTADVKRIYSVFFGIFIDNKKMWRPETT